MPVRPLSRDRVDDAFGNPEQGKLGLSLYSQASCRQQERRAGGRVGGDGVNQSTSQHRCGVLQHASSAHIFFMSPASSASYSLAKREGQLWDSQAKPRGMASGAAHSADLPQRAQQRRNEWRGEERGAPRLFFSCMHPTLVSTDHAPFVATTRASSAWAASSYVESYISFRLLSHCACVVAYLVMTGQVPLFQQCEACPQPTDKGNFAVLRTAYVRFILPGQFSQFSSTAILKCWTIYCPYFAYYQATAQSNTAFYISTIYLSSDPVASLLGLCVRTPVGTPA